MTGWRLRFARRCGFGLLPALALATSLQSPPLALGATAPPPRAVWAWGDNTFGELGNGTARPVSTSTAGDVSSISGAVSIANGADHSVAALADGTVVEWGRIVPGTPGGAPAASCPDPGYPTPFPCYTRPTVVVFPQPLGQPPAKARAVASGVVDVALMQDGTVWTWVNSTVSNNSYGDLGDGAVGRSAANEIGPVHVVVRGGGLLDHVVAVSAGLGSLAVRDDGGVWGWGDGSYDLIGPRHAGPPQPVAGSADQVSVYDNGCEDYYDNSGPGASQPYYDVCPFAVPVVGPGGSGQFSVGAGGAVGAGIGHYLALKADGSTVWGWGQDTAVNIGPGCAANYCGQHPAPIAGLTGVSQISVGPQASLALRQSDGAVWAWGSWGSRGTPQVVPSPTPRLVPALTAMTGISEGDDDGFAIAADGALWGWGYNGQGQLGNGSFADTATPVRATGLTHVKLVAAGYAHTIAATDDGKPPDQGRLGPPAPLPQTVQRTPIQHPPGLVAQAPVPLPQPVAPAVHAASPANPPGPGHAPAGQPLPHQTLAGQSAAGASRALAPVAATHSLTGSSLTSGGPPGAPLAQVNPGMNPAVGPAHEEGPSSATEYAMVRHTVRRDMPGLALAGSALAITGCYVAYRRRRWRVLPCAGDGCEPEPLHRWSV